MKKLSEKILVLYPYIFAILYFILLMFIETSTIHAFQNKSFLLSSEYLKPYLLHSGGILDYWGIFFNEILDFNIPGALLYSLLFLVSILLYQRILVKMGISQNQLLISLIPFSFLFVLVFNHFHPIAFNLKLITSFLFFILIVKITHNKIPHKVINTLLLVLLWYTCGLEFFLISIIYYAVLSTRNKSYMKDSAVILCSSIIVFLFNTYLFYTPLASYPKEILSYPGKIPFILAITYTVLLLTPVFAIIKTKIKVPVLVQFLSILVIAAFLGKSSFDELNHIIGKTMAAGNKRNFDKVLDIRDNTNYNSRIISAYTNMALLNKRLLLTSLFKYDQPGGTDGIFPSRDFDNFTAYLNMRLSFDMGSINPTIRWAMEASTFLGYNTEILRHLIICHLINDNVPAAEKYYTILQKTLFHRKLKKELKLTISNYKAGKPNKTIMQKRNLRPPEDFYSSNGNTPENFEWALKTINNHKAVEFYIAVCLLNNEFRRLLDILPLMRGLGYKTLPAHFQEAMCLFYAEGQTPPNLLGYDIDRNLFQNCVWFFQTLSKYNENLMAANNEITQRAAHTYWYYLYYVSPVTKRANR